MTKWGTLFDDGQPKAGASEEEIAEMISNLGQPLNADEVAQVNHFQAQYSGDPFDPSLWQMPADRPIPESYVSFVRWSNGGNFEQGDRYFQMWGVGLRDMMLAFSTPEYVPGFVPFAFNGGGVMYGFDMREPPVDDEYPIVCMHTGT